MSEIPSPEFLAPVGKLSEAVSQIHASFLNLAPNFDRGIWVPHEAIKQKAGSCAAEAFFVAKSLIDAGVVEKKDLSLGVFTNHGEEVRIGFVGKTVKNPGHVALFVVIDGVTYELNFRMNRADEDPTIEEIGDDSLSEARLKWVEPIEEAFGRYGVELSDKSGLSLGFDNCVDGPPTNTSSVRFNEEF